jgi:hypothetical protein
MVRLCGASLGSLAFGVTILLGLLASIPVDIILTRALWALAIFFGIGLFTGWVASRVLDEHAKRLKSEMFKEVDTEVSEQVPAEATVVEDEAALQQGQKQSAKTPTEVAAGTS